MLAWYVLSGALGYLAVTLLTARAAYGRQRARIIEGEADWHVDDDPVARFESNDRSSAATSAFLFGLAWPLTLPAAFALRCARYVITSHPPPSGPERARRTEDLHRRIHELEQSLQLDQADKG
ncbi:hypothetical protein [Streptomyces sp. 6N223]|uniref:hypothetical protein n=1 Tax=Streptomyces sp. 6N223 TaxID=3457412 RepID=UPI003FD035EB